jgi:hypothetical protein
MDKKPMSSECPSSRPPVDIEHFQDQLKQWRELESAAQAAERRLRDVGQLTASPEAAAWVRDAFQKRRAADGLLLCLLGSSKRLQGASNDPMESEQRLG